GRLARRADGLGLGHQLVRLDQDAGHARAQPAAEAGRRRDHDAARRRLPARGRMRRRLVVALVSVAAARVLPFAVPLRIVQQHERRDQELVGLQRDGVAAPRAIAVPGKPNAPVEVPPSKDRLAVYGTNGRLVTGAGPAVADGPVRSALRTARPATAERAG